jgi:putative ABC transport system permease protein
VEIGIRRALGAPPRLILRQFLSEALVLTGLGGLLGISLGVGLAYVATLILRRALGVWALHLEPWAMLLGFGSSLLVGLVFGLYPALRAARLDVVEALRNE